MIFGKFIGAKYEIRDGNLVRFMETKELAVPVIDPESMTDDMVKKAVDNFFENGDIGESMMGIISVMPSKKSPVDQIQDKIDNLFAGGNLWRKQIEQNKEKSVAHGWDYGLGVPMNIKPKFENVCEGLVNDDELEDFEEETEGALRDIESKFMDMYEAVLVSYQNYKGATAGLKNKDGKETEEDRVLSNFEAFSEDYLDHLKEVVEFISESVKETGCVVCRAIVHDAIAHRARELELAGRLIRKVSAQLT